MGSGKWHREQRGDISNTFIQTNHPIVDKDGNKTTMQMRGKVVDILCQIDPLYKDYVIEEQGQSMVYVHITKAIYGLLVSAMLFYEKLATDLQKEGYIINPYNPCVANKIIDGRQHTVSWHVDDLKFSHKKPSVNDKFVKWICTIEEVKVTGGKIHDYLGMTLN